MTHSHVTGVREPLCDLLMTIHFDFDIAEDYGDYDFRHASGLETVSQLVLDSMSCKSDGSVTDSFAF